MDSDKPRNVLGCRCLPGGHGRWWIILPGRVVCKYQEYSKMLAIEGVQVTGGLKPLVAAVAFALGWLTREQERSFRERLPVEKREAAEAAALRSRMRWVEEGGPPIVN